MAEKLTIVAQRRPVSLPDGSHLAPGSLATVVPDASVLAAVASGDLVVVPAEDQKTIPTRSNRSEESK